MTPQTKSLDKNKADHVRNNPNRSSLLFKKETGNENKSDCQIKVGISNNTKKITREIRLLQSDSSVKNSQV